MLGFKSRLELQEFLGKTRHTHSVNASCSYEVHEDIICIHTNGSLKEWHYCGVIVHMEYQEIQSNYGLSAYI